MPSTRPWIALVIGLATGLCHAQTKDQIGNPSPNHVADNQAIEETADNQAILDLGERLRELAIAEILQSQSPARRVALEIVHDRSIVDERFNDVVAAGLKSEQVDEVLFAIELMPYTTLSDQSQVKHLLDLAVSTEVDAEKDGRQFQYLVSRLKKIPREAVEQLESRLSADKPPRVSIAIAARMAAAAQPLIPHIIRIAESGPEQSRVMALEVAHRLIKHAQVAQPPQPVGRKFLAYAERIIARYDNDHDGQLSKTESSEMLLDPTPADTDRDGLVTATEYARFLESRRP